MPRETGAFAFYNTICIRRPIQPRITPGTRDAFAMLMAHEYCHVLQYRKHPLLFLPYYYLGILYLALASMWNTAEAIAPWWQVPFEFFNQLAKGGKHFRSGYLNHPYETEARAYEKLYFVEWIMALEEIK
jgi:hypothetical protein